MCDAPGFSTAPHSGLSPGAGGANCLAGKFGSSEWAYEPLPPVHFSLGIQLPLAARILPCSPTFYILGGWGGDTRYRARPDLFHHCPGPGAKSVKGSVSAVKPKPDSPGLVLSFDLHPPDPSVISNGAELSQGKMRGALGVVIERPAVSNPNAFYITCPINGSC